MTRNDARTGYDLAVIGGGINGTGIACDAAGRGLSVLLVEAGDLAGATSSASSKLIHGGLRYLEHGEFRLVREALAEREVLLAKAPHIVWPLRFVLPHASGMRPRWLIRLGLVLYDNLYRRRAVPGSRALRLQDTPAGRPLREGFRDGFAYWDCWVDDARLVVLNARGAADKGAAVRTRTRFLDGRREGPAWRIRLRNETTGREEEVRAGALVNAAGPWAGGVLERLGRSDGARVDGAGGRLRLVKGSHIVVPRIEGADDAYILQHDDGRVVFVLPYEQRYSLIGTTDVAFAGDPAAAAVSAEEVAYLLETIGRYFRCVPRASDIVWRYAGVRPLYEGGSDGGNASPSKVTRDYRLSLSAGAGAPLLSVLGGKITTYRRMAELALDRLRPCFPKMGRPWTATAPLPGGAMAGADFEAFLADLRRRHDRFGPAMLRRLGRRHGTLTDEVIGDARSLHDMGAHLGAGLYAREVDYLARREWARTAEDILWRRTKTALHLDPAACSRAESAIEAML